MTQAKKPMCSVKDCKREPVVIDKSGSLLCLECSTLSEGYLLSLPKTKGDYREWPQFNGSVGTIKNWLASGKPKLCT